MTCGSQFNAPRLRNRRPVNLLKRGQTLSKRPAFLEPLTGYERFTTEQLVAKEQVAFTIRWAQIVDDVSPLDRIVCPASALVNSPTEPQRNKIYDILMIHPIGRNEGLKILAAVRQDEMH